MPVAHKGNKHNNTLVLLDSPLCECSAGLCFCFAVCVLVFSSYLVMLFIRHRGSFGCAEWIDGNSMIVCTYT